MISHHNNYGTYYVKGPYSRGLNISGHIISEDDIDQILLDFE